MAKAYPMTRHGFARQSEFIILESDEVHAVYSLPNSEHTVHIYPYKFDFQVLYTLIENALRITYKMISHDKKNDLFFGRRGHPAFNVPFKRRSENYEDYYIEFEIPEKLETHSITPEGFFGRRNTML